MKRVFFCCILLAMVVFLVANAFAQGNDSAGAIIRELCGLVFGE